MRIATVVGAVLCGILLAVTVTEAGRVKVVIEAEHYATIQPSMAVAKVKGASLGKCIYIPLRRPHGKNERGPTDDGNAVYKIEIPQNGMYRLWARAKWYDSCGDSFFVILDKVNKSWIGEDGTYQKWHWVQGKTYELKAGEHLIKFQNREDGAELDQFLLTTDLRYVPTRIETETVQYNLDKKHLEKK